MLRVDITFSALCEHAEQRVRLAVQLLAAYRIQARLRPWDGTRCDLLVTDLADAYGLRTHELARNRGTPVLAFHAPLDALGDGVAVAAENSLSSNLAQSMRDLLAPVDARDDRQVVRPEALPVLCRLADNEFKGHAVDAACNGRLVRIRPEEGRIYAPTLSDLLSAIDTFCVAEWTLAHSSEGAAPAEDGASRSLEAFLLQAAFASPGALPRFPEGHYRLEDWPDVGSVPERVGSLRIAKRLLDGGASPSDLVAACQTDATEVNATLWAFAAANLLQVAIAPPREEPAQEAPSRALSGIMARLAVRFGLSRS